MGLQHDFGPISENQLEFGHGPSPRLGSAHAESGDAGSTDQRRLLRHKHKNKDRPEEASLLDDEAQRDWSKKRQEKVLVVSERADAAARALMEMDVLRAEMNRLFAARDARERELQARRDEAVRAELALHAQRLQDRIQMSVETGSRARDIDGELETTTPAAAHRRHTDSTVAVENEVTTLAEAIRPLIDVLKALVDQQAQAAQLRKQETAEVVAELAKMVNSAMSQQQKQHTPLCNEENVEKAIVLRGASTVEMPTGQVNILDTDDTHDTQWLRAAGFLQPKEVAKTATQSTTYPSPSKTKTDDRKGGGSFEGNVLQRLQTRNDHRTLCCCCCVRNSVCLLLLALMLLSWALCWAIWGPIIEALLVRPILLMMNSSRTGC